MYLRNKKTGEIKEVIVGGYPVSGKTKMWECSEMDMNEETGYKSLGTYSSLAELNEEWEDYQESEASTHITGPVEKDDNTVLVEFYTYEEAEKAVEKLKAFKRLQKLGFRFDGIRFRDKHNYIEWKIEPKNELTDDESGKLMEDLYEVFGGK